MSEIRIPSVVETSKKTGKVYNQNTEAAWFGVDGIDDITVQIATQWCQPPKLLGTYDKHAQGIYWCINPVTPSHLENYGTDLQCRKTGLTRDVDISPGIGYRSTPTPYVSTGSLVHNSAS